MQQRVFSFFLILILASSCQFFTGNKKSAIKNLDSIIDFSSVDVSPTFAVCDSLIDKKAISDCFKSTLHQQLLKNLSKQQISVENPVSETIQVFLKIDKKGTVGLKKITMTKQLHSAMPNLDSLLRVGLQQLPKLFPAIKRGIPVTTEYQLPIKISIAN